MNIYVDVWVLSTP